MKKDSVDKIIGYLGAVCAEEFSYKEEKYIPTPLYISNGIFRGYTCPPDCGACCTAFSLDYLPTEEYPEGGVVRNIIVNEKRIPIYSIFPKPNAQICMFLDTKNGRCNIHPIRPFTCDFELLRFAISASGSRNMLNCRLYGRGWNMLRIDGERGAICEMTPPTKLDAEDNVRKLKRLEQWAIHFQIKTKLPQIIEWMESIIRHNLQNRIKEGVIL